jgi:hypothetical protein
MRCRHYDFAAARCVIAFGADFLETFGSPVAQARGFAAMRANRADGAGHFVTVEPRLSANRCERRRVGRRQAGHGVRARARSGQRHLQ